MIVSLDIETKCGLGCQEKCDHALDPYRNAITIIGVYWEEAGQPREATFRTVKELIDFHLLHQPKYVGFNLKWDLHVLAVKGFVLPYDMWEDDALIMSSVLTEKVPEGYVEQYELERRRLNKILPKGYQHRQTKGGSLKILAPYFLGVEPFWEDPTNHDSVEYVLKDCKYTYQLVKLFETELKDREEYAFYKEWLLPKVKLLARMERRGVMIDLELMEEMDRKAQMDAQVLRTELDELWSNAYAAYFGIKCREIYAEYDAMYEKAATKLKDPTEERLIKLRKRYDIMAAKVRDKLSWKMNIDSPAQLKWLLQDYFKLDVTDFDGEESTGKAVLEKLAGQGRADIKLFLQYRATRKLTTAFFPSYREKQVGSVIHATFNAHSVRTGRLSSSEPNLQQVPGLLHKIFRARPGYKFIVKDEAAIEPRLIAALTEDPILTGIIQQDADVHGYNTKIFFEMEEPVEKIKKAYPIERGVGKEVGLAILYGAGKDRLGESAQKRGFVWTEQQCKDKIANFKEAYSTVYTFREELKRDLLQGVIYNLFGRPISIPNPEDIHMKGLNTVIQSSASDLVIDAADYAQSEYDRLGLDAHVVILVHDEIIVEAAEEIAKQAEAILEYAMTRYHLTTSLGDIKLKVEGNVGDRWEK